jgi:1-phosphatidylinositol-3-phosphate 5-kinase
VRLAESEKEHPSRHMTGKERAALTCILGWEGKKAAGRGNLISTAAFLRQQKLSFLYSEHMMVPVPIERLEPRRTMH